MPTQIDPARTWLVSDTHFGHENIKAFCHRPQDVEQIMMEEWAREVPEDGVVLHLGDLSWRSNAFFKNMIAPHLTGVKKYLILGNHDRQRRSFYRDSGFQIVHPFSIRYDPDPMRGLPEWEVSFSHYPWSDEDEGRPMPERYLRVHGHIHNNGYTRETFVPFLKNHVNLSAEMTKYRPVNLKLLLDGVLLGRLPTPVEGASRASHG